MDWYLTINTYLLSVANKHGLSLETVAGIFVSFSAQKTILTNMKQLEQFLDREPITGMYSMDQLKAATRIIKGESPLAVWRPASLKYRNFYASCLLIDGSVCVDTHMINAYFKKFIYSKLQGQREKIFASKKHYSVIQKWVMLEAHRLSVKSYEMQALLWIEQRGASF